MSLYDDLGGAPAIAEALDAFYTRVLDDPRIGSYFDGVDLARLKVNVGAFFAMALGGPDDYRGRGLGAAHARLRTIGLDEPTIDVFLGHFRQVLEDFEVDATTIDAVLVVADNARPEVLGS
jgi:hemoglobin